MNEKNLLLKIASMKEGEPLCHTSDPRYKHYRKLCQNLKGKGLLTYKRPFGGIAVTNYKGTSRHSIPLSPGFLVPKLTYDGLTEATRIRHEAYNRHIAIVGVCISLAALLIPLLCKYLPQLYTYLTHLP